jgi:hypothetical protein
MTRALSVAITSKLGHACNSSPVRQRRPDATTVGGNRDLTTVGVLGDFRRRRDGERRRRPANSRSAAITRPRPRALARVVGAAENVMAIQGRQTATSAAPPPSPSAAPGPRSAASAPRWACSARAPLSAGGPLLVRASNVSINASVLSERYAGAYQGKSRCGKLTVKAPVIKLQAGGAFKAKGATCALQGERPKSSSRLEA